MPGDDPSDFLGLDYWPADKGISDDYPPRGCLMLVCVVGAALIVMGAIAADALGIIDLSVWQGLETSI